MVPISQKFAEDQLQPKSLKAKDEEGNNSKEFENMCD
jgi:hypothetical protein